MILNLHDSGNGPLVVLLHGFPLDSRMWQPQLGALSGSHRLLIPDLRGFGRTEMPLDDAFPIDDMADDVMRTLESIQATEPFVLGGLSMGGYLALSIAARYPTRLRGLMLMDTRAGADTAEAARNRVELADHVDSSGDVSRVVEGMLPRLFSPASQARSAEIIEPVEHLMRSARPHAVAAALRGMSTRPDRSGELHQILVPTLVLVGADDAITPPAEARALAEAIPNASFVEIPAAGHLAPLENPSAANTAILNFLTGIG